MKRRRLHSGSLQHNSPLEGVRKDKEVKSERKCVRVVYRQQKIDTYFKLERIGKVKPTRVPWSSNQSLRDRGLLLHICKYLGARDLAAFTCCTSKALTLKFNYATVPFGTSHPTNFHASSWRKATHTELNFLELRRNEWRGIERLWFEIFCRRAHTMTLNFYAWSVLSDISFHYVVTRQWFQWKSSCKALWTTPRTCDSGIECEHDTFVCPKCKLEYCEEVQAYRYISDQCSRGVHAAYALCNSCAKQHKCSTCPSTDFFQCPLCPDEDMEPNKRQCRPCRELWDITDLTPRLFHPVCIKT